MKYLTALLGNLIFTSSAFAMAGSPGGGQKGGGSLLGLLLPMVIVFGVFYLLLIRPQQKQQKKVKAMLDSMQKGDDVITRAGIYGRIHGIAEGIVTLEIAPNVKIRVGREHIGAIVGKEDALKK